jgi:cytochrome c oxidase subunit 2
MGAPLLAGCRGAQSMLDPAGPSASAIATVWWWMLAVAAVVFVGVVIAWFMSMRPHAAMDAATARRVERRFLIGGGLLLPTVSVTALLVFGSPAGFHQLPLPGSQAAPLRIEAIGHQWWWEIRYPNGQSVRNELRLPAGRPVDVHTKSGDVIHSFWVPALGGKLDAVPGRTLVVRLQGDRLGTYRGQCAEFCGVGHAHMTMSAVVMEPEAFDAWLQAGAKDNANAAGTQ